MNSFSHLVLGKQPNISHLRIFGCAVYIPITPIQRTKMGPQRRLRIYVGFDSPSIIRYLKPLTIDVFIARFVILMRVYNDNKLHGLNLQCELKVQRIIHLQNLANQFPDASIDTKKVTSHISQL